MNRTIRIVGIFILLIGISLSSYFSTDGIDFISGILVGIGIGLIVTGSLFRKKKE